MNMNKTKTKQEIKIQIKHKFATNLKWGGNKLRLKMQNYANTVKATVARQ